MIKVPHADQVVSVIFEAIDEVNQLLPTEQQLEKSVDTLLHDRSGKLDSLGLVNFSVAAEQKVEEKFGAYITLSDEEVITQQDSPFKTVRTLADYIVSLLKVKADG